MIPDEPGFEMDSLIADACELKYHRVPDGIALSGIPVGERTGCFRPSSNDSDATKAAAIIADKWMQTAVEKTIPTELWYCGMPRVDLNADRTFRIDRVLTDKGYCWSASFVIWNDTDIYTWKWESIVECFGEESLAFTICRAIIEYTQLEWKSK